MSGNWAYTAFGATRGEDYREVSGPHLKDEFTRHLLGDTRNAAGAAFDKGVNVIAFDGKKWFVGQAANSTAEYSFDQMGRSLSFLQGYTSDSAHLPERVPMVDSTHWHELYQKHIAPTWNEHDIPKNMTAFEKAHAEITLAEHLPPEMLNMLRKAQAEGKPIALHYDPHANAWERNTLFERRMQKEMQKAAEVVTNTVTHASSSESPVLKETERNAKAVGSWVSRAWEHPAGKAGAIGAAVVAAGTLGYWALRTEDKNNQQGPAAGK